MPDRRPEFESETAPRLTGTLDGKYNYVPLGSRKPCLHVKSWWPNLDWRMYNSNSLAFIADFLVSFPSSRIPRHHFVSHLILFFRFVPNASVLRWQFGIYYVVSFHHVLAKMSQNSDFFLWTFLRWLISPENNKFLEFNEMDRITLELTTKLTLWTKRSIRLDLLFPFPSSRLPSSKFCFFFPRFWQRNFRLKTFETSIALIPR